MTTRDVVIAIIFLVLGWCLCMIWSAVLDWIYNLTGWVGSWAWNAFAMIGIGTVVVGLAALIM